MLRDTIRCANQSPSHRNGDMLPGPGCSPGLSSSHGDESPELALHGRRLANGTEHQAAH